eukprot:IDg20438t1
MFCFLEVDFRQGLVMISVPAVELHCLIDCEDRTIADSSSFSFHMNVFLIHIQYSLIFSIHYGSVSTHSFGNTILLQLLVCV